ncbi:MAG: aldo/keto reductase [Lachnospiraceae bacterium]|nr:aldo/keto reductase [Lachnospiraceae bacterium]
MKEKMASKNSTEGEREQTHVFSIMDPKIVRRYRTTCLDLSGLTGLDSESMFQFLKDAVNLGFRRFDISGIREVNLDDQAFTDYIIPNRSDFHFTSESRGKSPENIRKDLKEALELLRSDYLDVLFLTEPSRIYREGDGTGMIECLKDLVMTKKIRQFGIRLSDPDLAREAIESNIFQHFAFPASYLSGDSVPELMHLAADKGITFWVDRPRRGNEALDIEANCAFVFTNQPKLMIMDWHLVDPGSLKILTSYYDTCDRNTGADGQTIYITPEIERLIRKERFLHANNGLFAGQVDLE